MIHYITVHLHTFSLCCVSVCFSCMCPLSCAYSTTLFAWLHLFSTSFDELNRELEALLTQLDGVAIPVKAAEAAKQAEEVGKSG